MDGIIHGAKSLVSGRVGLIRHSLGRRFSDHVSAHSDPYPFHGRIEKLKLVSPEEPRLPDVRIPAYLESIEAITRRFLTCQAADGRILDPVDHREHQYSTPCFSFIASILATNGMSSEFRAPAVSALRCALRDLEAGRAADAHGDFYTVHCVLAYELLAPLLSEVESAVIRKAIRRISPDIAYTDVYRARRQSVHNWNVAALTGEFLRTKTGTKTTPFVDLYLRDQLDHFTPSGIYLDPDEPIIYDIFPRYFLEILMAYGYAGAYRDELEHLLARGARTSLLIQAPTGELPTGGRSKLHTWGEAVQSACFEMAANREAAAGNSVLASRFRRAAALSHSAVVTFKRPSGDLSVVKNFVSPELRHGFESYSNHAQYNLLAAAALAVAYQHSRSRGNVEYAAPCEFQREITRLPEFNTIVGHNRGFGIQVNTCADEPYDSTGLVRVARAGNTLGIGPTDAGPGRLGEVWWDGRRRHVNWRTGPPVATSRSVGWGDDEHQHFLGSFGRASGLKASVSDWQSADGTPSFSIDYAVPACSVCGTVGVREVFELHEDHIRVESSVAAATTAVWLSIPTLESDGVTVSESSTTNSVVTTRFDGSECIVTLVFPESIRIDRNAASVAFRGGTLETYRATAPGYNRIVHTVAIRLSGETPDLTPKSDPHGERRHAAKREL